MEYLLVMSLSGSVMVGIYMLLRYATGNKVSARLQYILAKIAVLYYLMPLPFIKRWYDGMTTQILPVKRAEVLRVSPRWDYYAVRANEKLYYNSYTKIQAVVIAVWLLITLIILVHEIYDYLQTRRILTRCMGKARIATDASIKRLKQQCGIKRKIVVYQGRPDEGTMTFGFFKPVILCGNQIGSKEAEYILRHELIHIRRWDTVWRILLRVVIFLHWWNPVAWFLYFDFERVCEWSCDEETVSGRTKEEVKEYIRLLIYESTKGKDDGKSRLRWGVSFGSGAKKLKKRMENVMMMKKWNKIAAGIIAAELIFVNSLTVFAYPDVNYQEYEKYLTQDEINHEMEVDEWVFIPDTLDERELGEYALYRGECTNIMYDKQFTDAKGNIYPIEDGNSTNVYANCTHTYVSGTMSKHTKNPTGGCTITIYSAQRCTKCGNVLMGDLINEITYAVCTH